jgi:hypothetical protein
MSSPCHLPTIRMPLIGLRSWILIVSQDVMTALYESSDNDTTVPASHGPR